MTSTYSFSHDVETIFDKLTDPDFLVERCVALGEKDIQCDVESDGRLTTVVLSRTIKRDLPAVLAKIFGAENRMVMTEKWEDIGKNKIGSYTVDVQGQPVTLAAKFKLKSTDKGCEYSIDFSCKAKIPLLGGKVEEFILSQTEAGMHREMDYLAKKLI